MNLFNCQFKLQLTICLLSTHLWDYIIHNLGSYT